MKTNRVDSVWLRLSTNLIIASCLRVGLIVYGLIQDQLMLVKYTDIDYVVFTDGARLVTQGQSPYLRSTYRYTPLLAWLLQSNIWLNHVFGKILFSTFDILAGHIIYRLVFHLTGTQATSMHCAQLWLFNPITLAVSTRGNAESFMAVLVLGMLLCVSKNDPLHLMCAGVLYGTAVHVKIYPVTYFLAVFLFLNEQSYRKATGAVTCRNLLWLLFPQTDLIIFAASAFLAFCGLTGVFYACYGDIFLQETYFYHLTRRDIRHNFSPYFYLLYLLSTQVGDNAILSIAMFLPQIILMAVSAVRYHHHLEFACFVQTFIFVTFNKVCTSQYFLWYICLLPLVLPQLAIGLRKALVLGVLWLIGQGLWLFPAYLLEFHCFNSFIYIWLAGLAFFTINVFILFCLITGFESKTVENSHKKTS